MKALTVQPPWSWAIFHGKNIENRSPGALHWKHRGDLLIHSGQRISTRGLDDHRVKAAWVQGDPRGVVGPLDAGAFDYGVLLGVVELVGIHRCEPGGCCRPWGESSYPDSTGHLVTAVAHLELANPRRFAEPVLVPRGKLGIWECGIDPSQLTYAT